MQIKITWQYIAAFFALNMVMGELHEQVHITTGYFICGCYGTRDFNVWSTCETCAHPSWAFFATAAGPLFSCSLMWLGARWFSKSKQVSKPAVGFSLLFANLPFARIFTAFTGSGDEKVVARFLLGEHIPVLLSKIIAAIIVFIICAPPVVMVYKKLNNHNRVWIVIGFLILPLIYGMLYQRLFLNLLLKKGLASQVHILGSPNLVLIHFMLMLLVLLVLRKKIVQAFYYR